MSINFFSIFNKKNVDYILTLVISGILFWLVNFFGLGYTYDSHLYVEIARQINSTSFFLVEGFNIKPPVLPLVISLLGHHNMVWVNFLCFVCIQMLGVFWSRKIGDQKARYLFLIILIFSTPHILINSFLWTEPLFLTAMLFSFYFLDRYYKTSQYKFLILGIVLLFLLPFIRFAGIFLVFPILVLLLISTDRNKIIFTSFLILMAIASGWVLLFSEGFAGRWDRFIRPFVSGRLNHLEFNLSSYSKALSSWFFPYAVDGILTRLISVSILLGVIYKSTKAYFNTKGTILFIAPLVFFIYFFLMMSVFKVEYYSAERYISIFYLLIFLNIFLHIDCALKIVKSIYLKWGAYCILLIFAVYSFLRTLKNVYFWYNLRSNSFGLTDLDSVLSLFW